MRRVGSQHPVFVAVAIMLGFTSATAHATYWNLFNMEGERTIPAQYVTYATLDDMLRDTNRTSVTSPNSTNIFGRNVVGTGSDGRTWWSVFNVEGESDGAADIVTYATLTDMLNDTNRTRRATPDGMGMSKNLVDAGSDGQVYWNLFNMEGERAIPAQYVTYATLDDMLRDINRTSVTSPNSTNIFGRNVVGTGSNGRTYWSVFNVEGESDGAADIVTYATLTDMLNDTNRIGRSTPDAMGMSKNLVGSGSDDFVLAVPEPTSSALLGLAAALLLVNRRRATPR